MTNKIERGTSLHVRRQIEDALDTLTAGAVSAANPTATASDVAVNGVASTFMRSDAAPAVQKGSSSAFGVVKVDNSTITASGGVISATATTTSPAGSANQIQYRNASSAVFDAHSGFEYDEATGVFSTQFAVIGSGATYNANPTGADVAHVLEIVGNATGGDAVAGNYGLRIISYGALAPTSLHFARALGTQASPTTVTSGTALLALDGRGYNGSAMAETSCIMYVKATENFTTGANGAEWTWEVTPNGTTPALGRTTRFKVTSAGVEVIGSALFSAMAAPSTPASGKGIVYVDSTSKNLCVKDDAGVVKHGVQTNAGASNQFVTAISDAGVISLAQPSFSNLSGALSGDVTTSGTVATIANDAVTLAKMQNAAGNSKLLGSGDAGSGSDYVEITVGSGLSMTGTTLAASGGSGGGISGFDQFIGNVVSLLHFEGTNGATTTTDLISSNSWTFHGNAQISTSSPLLGTSSLLLDGNGDYIDRPNDVRLHLGIADFCFEFTVRFVTNSANQCVFAVTDNSGANNNNSYWCIFYESLSLSGGVKHLRFAMNNDSLTQYQIDSTAALNFNQAYQVAVGRKGNVLFMFIDGAAQNGSGSSPYMTSGATPQFTFFNTSQTIKIGSFKPSSGAGQEYYMNGKVDEFRMTVGQCRWSRPYTPSATAFPDA